MKPRALYQQAKGGTLRRVFALSYPISVANLSQILLGVGAGLIVLLVLSIGASSLFAVFGVSEAVRAEGVPYLRVLAFAAILAAATAMFRAVYASMGETSVAMRMTFLVNAINIPLNYVLMVVVPAILQAPELVAPSPILHLLTSDVGVVAEASRVLPILALQVPFMALSMVLAAVLRAAGDSRRVFYTSTVSGYLFVVPLSWLLAIPFGWELAGVYVAGIAFFAARTAGSWWPCRQRNWRVAAI